MAAELDSDLRHALEKLSEQSGHLAGDLTDGHARWHLYQAAMPLPDTWPLLLRGVRLEPDSAVASAVVGGMLERVGPAEREEWVRALDRSVRAFSERRARELGLQERILAGDVPAAEVSEQLDDWSDWLQLRIASAVTDPEIRGIVAERGRTKRIRRTAREPR